MTVSLLSFDVLPGTARMKLLHHLHSCALLTHLGLVLGHVGISTEVFMRVVVLLDLL